MVAFTSTASYLFAVQSYTWLHSPLLHPTCLLFSLIHGYIHLYCILLVCCSVLYMVTFTSTASYLFAVQSYTWLHSPLLHPTCLLFSLIHGYIHLYCILLVCCSVLYMVTFTSTASYLFAVQSYTWLHSPLLHPTCLLFSLIHGYIHLYCILLVCCSVLYMVTFTSTASYLFAVQSYRN